MHQVFAVVLTACASAVAAWLGGKLGVRREAEKLIQARAFDRRLEWYERSVRALTQYTWTLKDFVRVTLESRQGQLEGAFAEISRIHPGTLQILSECELYGRPSTVNAMIRFAAELRRLMGPNMPTDKAGVSAVGTEIEREIMIAKQALIQEGRDHLGLEALRAGHRSDPKST